MKYNEVTDTERFYVHDGSVLKKYAEDVRFSNAQLQVIRHGLENGLDVSIYANPDIPASVMQMIFTHLKNRVNHYIVRYQEGDEIVAYPVICRLKQDALDTFSMGHKAKQIIDIRCVSEV